MTPTEAMNALGLTVESVFIPFSQSRNKGEKRRSLNWAVTVKRNGRDVLTTDYSAGIAHCPSYKHNSTVREYEAIEHETETGKAARRVNGGVILAGKPILPKPEDVLYSLTMDASVLDCATYEDWAAEIGFDPDSRKGEAIYRQCLELALKLRAAVGEAGLETLREAFQDY